MTDPTAPDPETVEALADWFHARGECDANRDGYRPGPCADCAEDAVALRGSPAMDDLIAAAEKRGRDEVRASNQADGLTDETGEVKHFPFTFDADGEGPTEPDPPHHRGCWCGDADCYWTRALAAERKQGRDEVAAAVETREDTVFLGSMSLMDALHATVTQHMWLTETEPPEPIKPYIWCACGWRSDDLGSDNPAASLQVHLANALHEAATDALQPIVLRKSAVRAAVAAAGASDLATIRSAAWREGYSHCFDAARSDTDVSLNDDPYRVAAEAGERQ